VTASPGAEARDGRPLPSRQVLLVEDDPALALMLTWELQDLGVTTALAMTCAEARALARSIRFELALVDVDLPDGDGLVLAEGLAAAHPRATVAIHTGRHGCDPSPFRANALKHVLIKPISVDHLIGLLSAGPAERPRPAPSRAAARPGRRALASDDG
jgi:DNA-binding response OmpR family regulator